MGILGELSHIHGPRKANLFSQCSSGHRDSHVTGQQRVSNRFIFRSGRTVTSVTPISDTKLDSLVSFLAEETSPRLSFVRSFVEKKKKRNKIKRDEFIRAPFLLFSSFLFLLSLRSRKISTTLLFLSFFPPLPSF